MNAPHGWAYTSEGMTCQGMEAIEGYHVSREAEHVTIKRLADGETVFAETCPPQFLTTFGQWLLVTLHERGIALEPGEYRLGTDQLVTDLVADYEPPTNETPHARKEREERERIEAEMFGTRLSAARSTRSDDEFTIRLKPNDPLSFQLLYREVVMVNESFPDEALVEGFPWLLAVIAHGLNQEYAADVPNPSTEALREWYERVSPIVWAIREERIEAEQVETADAYPKGRTASEIRESPLPETPWMIEGWVAPGQLVKFAAREKSGKSTLLYHLLAQLEVASRSLKRIRCRQRR